MEASAEGGGVPWAKEGMLQTREWVPFLGPEDMPSLCAVDKSGFLLYAMETMQSVDKHCYEALEEGGPEGGPQRRANFGEVLGYSEEGESGKHTEAETQNNTNKIDFEVAVKWWEEHSNLLINPDSICEDLRCPSKELSLIHI